MRTSLLIEISVMRLFFVTISSELKPIEPENFFSGRFMSFLGRLVQSAAYFLEMLL